MKHDTFFKGVFAMVVVYFIVCVVAAVGAIYVVAHFLSKYW